MSNCDCLICTGTKLESLDWFIHYNDKLTDLKLKLESGTIDDYHYEHQLFDLDHQAIDIAIAVFKYANGRCAYRMYRYVLRLYQEDCKPIGENNIQLAAVLNQSLQSSDPMVVINQAFDKYIRLTD